MQFRTITRKSGFAHPPHSRFNPSITADAMKATSLSRLGIARVQLQYPQIFSARAGSIVQPLGIEISQFQTGLRVIPIARQNFVQFVYGIGDVTGRLEREREVVTGVGGIGPNGQRGFVGGQGERQYPKLIGHDAAIASGLEPRGIESTAWR